MGTFAITSNTSAGFDIELGAASTNIQINIGDTWKVMAAAQINIGDVWKDVTSVKINIGDVWKDVF